MDHLSFDNAVKLKSLQQKPEIRRTRSKLVGNQKSQAIDQSTTASVALFSLEDLML